MVQTDLLAYEIDSVQMESLLYFEESRSGKRPGILVFPEAFGLGDHAKSRAASLAALGFVTLACDLHGSGRIVDLQTAMALLGALQKDPSRIRARAGAALAQLQAHPLVDPDRLGAIGYCFGGTMALELARGGGDLAGVVGFHSGLATTTPEDAKNIKGKVLVCIGADDPAIPPDQRAAFEAEMREASVSWQMHLYGGVVHSFTNPAADSRSRPEFARYDPQADAHSWECMLRFFDDVFEADGD